MTTARTLATAEDLFKLPHDGRRYELLDGELREMSPTGYRHGKTESRVAHVVMTFVDFHGLGVVLTGEVGIILRRNPDRVRAPDVCFLSKDRLPAEDLAGFLEIIPDFVIEVVSPGDTAAEVQQKTEEWLAAGVKLAWTLYPDTRRVVASRSLTDIRVYTETEMIDAEPALPGFTCPVAELFS